MAIISPKTSDLEHIQQKRIEQERAKFRDQDKALLENLGLDSKEIEDQIKQAIGGTFT